MRWNSRLPWPNHEWLIPMTCVRGWMYRRISGTLVLAREDVALSRFQTGSLTIHLTFSTEVAREFEFKVAVTGVAALLIEEHRRVIRLDGPGSDPDALLNATRFPEPDISRVPSFFPEARPFLYHLYRKGAIIRCTENDIIVGIDGVSFYVRGSDDLEFVEEILVRNAYRFALHAADCCVIDIGMNIGLASLMFANKPFVREVHSFEPFESTYKRACANIALNPDLSKKIYPSNFGLADQDEERVVPVPDDLNSGSYSIAMVGAGDPQRVVIRDAAEVLGPIIKRARQNGYPVIAKIDCEAAEYAVFDSLERHGLLAEISAYVVEWHRTHPEYNRQDLITSLTGRGYIVFDLHEKGSKSGMFYAVKNA